MSKKTIIKGTLILTIAGIATKFLGFYNRIFLTRTIGVKEIGIYQLVFPMYILAFSISCSGLATALTKHISYYLGQNKYKTMKKITRHYMLLTAGLSIGTCTFLYIFSDWICTSILKNSDCSPLLRTIIIAIPFVALKAGINAFFVGVDKPGFQGITNFFEQIIRIGTGMLLAYKWADGGLTAKLAVVAVVSGEIAATVLSIFFYLITQKKIMPKSDMEEGKNRILKPFLMDAIPITTNNLMLTLFSSLETILIPAMLFYYYASSDKSMEIYGMLTGIIIPFLLFPATITTSLSTMLLPAVSYARARSNHAAILEAIKKSLIFCVFLGLLSWGFYMLFGKTLCMMTFKNEYAGILLQRVSFMCPLIYISGNMSAILNGIGKAFGNLMINVSGLVVRILITVSLVPSYGINAYFFGMTLSYLLLDISMLAVAIHFCKKKEDYIEAH
ncbi:MAG: oligosaccharide flippase family protein [Lachnospiraceae bacterium]|nr:oligosaccharide flippase family protein [Lachnospiraceae bacterium]